LARDQQALLTGLADRTCAGPIDQSLGGFSFDFADDRSVIGESRTSWLERWGPA
jgi:hypothetical protein